MTQVQQQAFDRFWQAYPRKVGKLAAAREWERAEPNLGDALAALAWQYPNWATLDLTFVPHPRTWIHQGRFLDEAPKAMTQQEPWYVECERLHGRSCAHRSHHELVMARAS